jgi:hypothetical protein
MTRVSVIVNQSLVSREFQTMADVIQAKLCSDNVQNVERETILALLQTITVVHLEYLLSRQQVNIGIEVYIQEYFGAWSGHLLSSPEVINFLSTAFLGAVMALAEQLKGGVEVLEQHCQTVSTIQTTPMGYNGSNYLYTIVGGPWD